MNDEIAEMLAPVIYRRLYGTPIPICVYRRYKAAIESNALMLSKEDRAVLTKIHVNKVDIVAFESVVRKKSPDNPATKLLRLMIYVDEISGCNQGQYIKEGGLIRTLLACAPLLILIVYIRLKGYYEYSRFKRV